MFTDNKIEKCFAQFGISIKNADGSFRDTCDVLKDITSIYEDLSERQKDLLKELFSPNLTKQMFEQCVKRK